MLNNVEGDVDSSTEKCNDLLYCIDPCRVVDKLIIHL